MTVTSNEAPIEETVENAPTQVPEGSTRIEADPNAGNETDDDGYGTASDAGSNASTSISSSVRDYEFENNRRYHKFQEGRYSFPNDDIEQEREDMKHAMILNLCKGKLHYAPLKNPQTILDIGTGTGIWSIDMGDEYPNAVITGIDLSSIQPSWLPPNVKFLVDDVEAEWLFPDNSLDYVHIRHMTAAIRDWPTLLSRAFKALKPGGWIEMQEMKFQIHCDDGTLREDNQVVEYLRVVTKGLAAFNVDLLSMRHNLDRVKDASFLNTTERIFKLPVGAWPRDENLRTVGLYNRSIFADGFQGIAMRPCTQGLGWSAEEVELFLVGVRKSLFDTKQHIYVPFHIVTAQKPEDSM